MTSEALPRSASVPREASPRAGRRGSPLWGGILFCVLAIWTLLISTVPDMRFQIFLPRARLPIETVGVVVTALASMFAYVRYSVGGSRRALLLSIAFLILSFNHLVFGLLIQPGRFGISPATDVYLWTAGRLWAGSLFLAGAVQSSVDREPHARVRRFLIGGVAALVVVGLGQFAIWLFRSDLPALFSGSISAAQVKGVLPGLTAV